MRNPLLVVFGAAVVAFAVGRGLRARDDAGPPTEQDAGRRASARKRSVTPQGAQRSAGGAPEMSTASGPVTLRRSSATAPARDDAAVRELIREGSEGTYLTGMLAQQENMVFRWPDRQLDALRVWIERNSTLPDFAETFPVVAERAFEEWSAAGFPLRFDVVADSSDADILIVWIQALDAGTSRIGLTRKTRDQNGWIVRADISIAMRDPAGAVLSPELVAGVARHEIGHALGLGHSADPEDVMYPESRTQVISASDRATMHLLYLLPPGLLR